MQVINKGQANTLVFTLTEKATLTSPVFLFELTSPENMLIYFIASDTSTFTNRYNRFTVIEGVNAPITGSIVCTTTGQYNYRIWEQSSATNLDPVNATTLLETGIIQVVGVSSNSVTYNPSRETITYYGATE